MTQEGYQEAAEYWTKRDAQNVKLEREELYAVMKQYIQENDTCALATGSGTYVRCTPIEYSYWNDNFWMFTEGGLKFVGLETNKNVSIAIFDKYIGFGKLKGMQVTGKAEVVEPFSENYIEATRQKKIPIEALKKLPQPMNLIRVIPSRIDFLNSDFKGEGYASRQFIEF